MLIQISSVLTNFEGTSKKIKFYCIVVSNFCFYSSYELFIVKNEYFVALETYWVILANIFNPISICYAHLLLIIKVDEYFVVISILLCFFLFGSNEILVFQFTKRQYWVIHCHIFCS